MTINDSTKIVAVEQALSTTLDGESVILHTGAGQYYGFNAVGTEIWELLDEPRTVAEIIRHIATEYEVEESECRNDVEELVDELRERNLIRVLDE